MRRIVSIGLFLLLLYNVFGLSFAVLLFEKDYQIASASVPSESRVLKMYLPSLPYSGNLEITEDIKGLVRHDGQFYNPTGVLHENDTLYVTLQSNEAARDHFFELANAMQLLNDPQTDAPENPYEKAVELLGSLLKVYIAGNQKFSFPYEDSAQGRFITSYIHFAATHYHSFKSLLASPPPERC
ncbi:hypothetical protein LZD49_32085 [Dyadobacter sp. CY261]|uniref:hypothetical protein n=1 Tax=Dyadobacter sp. CY261 TaxID=2907203 RepID=UPI001F433393|nr:hypothetical protein [Dyadobacter sp. CY261]MCF0075167.1 hypothetical protein [Dyadobacter sp. CY261]